MGLTRGVMACATATYLPLIKFHRVQGMLVLRKFLVAKYPAAVSLKESDIVDSSFIDEIEQSGFIDRLCAS